MLHLCHTIPMNIIKYLLKGCQHLGNPCVGLCWHGKAFYLLPKTFSKVRQWRL